MSAGSDGRALAAGACLPALRWRRVFPGEARELAGLRRFLAVLLPECAARDDVMCVATELGSNALRHTSSGRGGRFAVEVVWDAAAVHVAVSDGGAPSGPRVVDDPGQENGRGLLVVQGLSRGCGVCGDQRGRLVWADVPWADPEAVALGRWVAAVGDGGQIPGGGLTAVPGWLGRPILPYGLAGREGTAAVASGAGCPPVRDSQRENGPGLIAGRKTA
jgi:histidine kinase-like protein